MTTSQRSGWHRSRRVRALIIGVSTLAVAVPVMFQLGVGQAAVTPPSLPAPPYLNGKLYHFTDADSRPIRQTSGKWSVIAVHPDPGADWDLTVTRADDSAGSDQYGDRTDFVVVDGSVAGSGRPTARVVPWGDGGTGYDVAYNDQTSEFPFPVHRYGEFIQVGQDQWPTDQPFYRDVDGQSIAGIRDVSLVAGQDYMIKSQQGGQVFLMQSDGTPLQGRPEAIATVPDGKQCTWFRPRTSGTYGLVVTFDDGNSGYFEPQYVDVVKATPAQIRTSRCDGVRVDGR